MTDEQRRRFQRQVEDLKKIDTDDPGTPEQRERLREFMNELRAKRGAPPFPDEEEEPPELGFYRRARALGMVPRRHRDA